MQQFVQHTLCVPKKMAILTIKFEQIPEVLDKKRIEIIRMARGLFRVVARYGYAERVSVLHILQLCRDAKRDPFKCKLDETSFFLNRDILAAKPGSPWYHKLFVLLFTLLHQNMHITSSDFIIPQDAIVEFGHVMLL